MLDDLRSDLPRALAGVVLVGLAALVAVVATTNGFPVPIGFVLVPVLGVALVCGPLATGLVGLSALAAFLVSYAVTPAENWQLRFASVVLVVGLAVAGSAVRRRSERRLVRQGQELALAREHELSAEVTQRMLDRVTELSAVGTVEEVWTAAIAQSRELFGADVASYWQVEGDACELVASAPRGRLVDGRRAPMSLLAGGDVTGARETRTVWMRRADQPRGSLRAQAMRDAGVVAGSSTPIRVDGRTVAYLSLGWVDPPVATPAWLDLLDRFGDQVALAKTVVRRRAAQADAQRLGERLQRALLPQVDVRACGTQVRTLYRPGVRDLLLGGDFFDVLPLPDGGGVRFLIGDVSGHGPEPAALAATLRAAWQAMAALPGLDVEDWTTGLDFVLREQDGVDGSTLVTLLMGTVDLRTLQLRYANAGHPPPVVFDGRTSRIGPMSGPPLGAWPEPKLESHCVPLRHDSAVLMVTDGIFEGHVAPGSLDRLGYDEFVDLAAHDDAREPGYLERLADSMQVRNGGPLPDDVAALLIALDVEEPAHLV